MNATELFKLFEHGGAWAVVSVLIVAIGILAKYTMKLIEDRDKRERDRNKQMLELLEKRIEADVKHEQAFTNMAKAFERVADKL